LPRIPLIFIALLVTFSVALDAARPGSVAASAQAIGCPKPWAYQSGSVSWHGPSQSLYVKTPVHANITDQDGKSKANGGFITLKNQSRKYSIYWTSLMAGQHERELRPQEVDTVFMVAYMRSGGTELPADLSVKYCPAD
jgi:hypothetical protein